MKPVVYNIKFKTKEGELYIQGETGKKSFVLVTANECTEISFFEARRLARFILEETGGF